MELEGDGFCNAGGIRSETLEEDGVNNISNHHEAMQERNFGIESLLEVGRNVKIGD
jgi:hypothetical protein